MGGVGDSALPSPGNIKGIVGERAGLAAFAGFLLLVKMLSKQTGDLLLRYHHDIMYCVRASQFDHSWFATCLTALQFNNIPLP